MHVDVALLPAELVHQALRDETLVVMDVLRATTTLLTALESGAEAVVPAESVEEAYRLAGEIAAAGGRALLAGERHTLRIEGFDLGNSPLECTPETVRGRTLVMTTTNGTRAFRLARQHARASPILSACLRNVAAVAERCAARGADVVLVCAGTDGRLSVEDALCAGLIAERLAAGEGVTLGDGARLSRYLAGKEVGDLEGALRRGRHGRRLAAAGFDADLAFCARLDASGKVPRLDGDRLVL